MKSDYESRARKFAHILITLFAGCVDLNDFVFAIQEYNATHSRPLVYAHGVSRIAIIRSDYVIKFNIRPSGFWKDGRAGSISSEARVYEQAVADGMEHLLAKVTVDKENDRIFAIMPRIRNIGNESRNWYNYCTYEESEWLESHINDLHENNVGYRNGKVCVIDYAWEAWEA